MATSTCNSVPSCDIFNVALTGNTLVFRLYPHKINEAGYIGWNSNLSLTITYYLINISEPSAGLTDSNITCASTITTDFSGANLSTNFSIYKNGELQPGLSGAKTCANSTACIHSVAADKAKGDSFLCSVSAGDWSRNSSALVIPDTPPVLGDPFQTDNSSSAHSFIARARATDADGTSDIAACSVSDSIQCGPTYLEETGNLNEKECRSTCVSNGSPFLSLSFNFTDSDGTNWTTTQATFTFPNSAPDTGTVLLSLTSPNATAKYAEFSCSADGTDPDGDPVTRYYSFLADGSVVRGESTENAFSCVSDYSCTKGEQISCRAYLTDSFFAESAPADSGAETIANTPPTRPEISRAENGTVFFPSSDEDLDSVGYSLFGGNSSPPTDLVFFGADSSFLWNPAEPGTYYLRAIASDGGENSTLSETINFTIAQQTTTTTTIPATTTTISSSSGGGSGGGGIPDIPAAKPAVGSPSGPAGETLQFPATNPTNSTLSLIYNRSELSCSPESIPAGSKNLTISCTPAGGKTNGTFSFSFALPNGTAVLTQGFSYSFPSQLGGSSESRARSQLDRLFLIVSNCSNPDAKRAMESLQAAFDRFMRDKSSTNTAALEKSLAEVSSANFSCEGKAPGTPTASQQAGTVSASPASQIPTPAFTAASPQKNLLQRIWEAIANFFLGIWRFLFRK